MVIIIVMIISVYITFRFLLWLDIYNLPISKGNRGERIVKHMLGINDYKNSYYVINNINIIINDKKAQIDHIVICKSGIYIIETKNYKGYIYANTYDKEWIQSTKHRDYGFYSPYLQNITHCKRISEILGIKEHIFNVIVFVNNNVDKKQCKNIWYVEELKKIKYYDNNNLTANQCKEYYNKILSYEI